ncbi:unnamed protein product [Polarella glacialis]|uniref:Mpv17-like protein n=1 Tax=Polarella glacialis TaxID=89957 RepID=A0A813KC38_POLGL|nr:unnamed protein product [Polarella glacialis]
MWRSFSRYSRWVKEKPWVAIPVSTALTAGTGDVLCQLMECSSLAMKPRLADDETHKKFDVARVQRMMAYYFFYGGPLNALWYSKILPALVPMAVPTVGLVVAKVAVDETIFSGWCIASYLYGITYIKGTDHEGCLEMLQHNFMRVYLMDISFWPWIQFASFWWVPPHLQFAVVSVGGVFWSWYLSFVQENGVTNGRKFVKDEREPATGVAAVSIREDELDSGDSEHCPAPL